MELKQLLTRHPLARRRLVKSGSNLGTLLLLLILLVTISAEVSFGSATTRSGSTTKDSNGFNFVGLEDIPIAGTSVRYLDSSTLLVRDDEEDWNISNGSVTIKATVPGEMISDIFKSKLLDSNSGEEDPVDLEPYYEENWLIYAHVWNNSDWTYTHRFSL